MQDTAANPLVDQITEQLYTLSVDELRVIQDFVAYLAWKRRSPDQPPAAKKSAEARAIERIPDLDDPTKWITVIEAGEEVDEDVLNNWLKARGYQD